MTFIEQGVPASAAAGQPRFFDNEKEKHAEKGEGVGLRRRLHQRRAWHEPSLRVQGVLPATVLLRQDVLGRLR